MVNSNSHRFDQLRKELHNEQIAGHDKYPKTLNAAFSRLNQHKSYGNDTPLFSGEGTTFTTTATKSKSNSNKHDSDSDESNDGKIVPAPKHYSDWKCAVCGKEGHPPSSKYCHLVRLIKMNPKVRKGLQKKVEPDSDSDDSSSNKSKKSKRSRRSKSSKGSPKSAKSTKTAKAIIKETVAQTLATIHAQSSSSQEDSDSDSDSDSDQDGLALFTALNASASSRSSTSSNHRSVDGPWTKVARKKGKRKKHRTHSIASHNSF